MSTKRLFFCLVMAFIMALSGCGGSNVAPSPMMPACIETATFGCISAARYKEELERITETHRDRLNSSSHWGLAAIKAEQAYAHLELAKGQNAAPGEGVTVGLIDSGIDQEHPVFSGKNNRGNDHSSRGR